ncbi:MAG: biopolymer transporter ExbD [Planctomycetes bacterium]|nr:biopolymer transporter ExbD [Planctomycetota bacterium]
MFIRDEEYGEEVMFNLTPMIDVVFQLLIFFMVATTYRNPEKEISIDLPKADSGQVAKETPKELIINVFRDGRMTLGGSPVGDGSLVEALRRAAQQSSETPVNIRGDRLAHHEQIVRVMDACSQVGLGNLAVGTLKN